MHGLLRGYVSIYLPPKNPIMRCSEGMLVCISMYLSPKNPIMRCSGGTLVCICPKNSIIAIWNNRIQNGRFIQRRKGQLSINVSFHEFNMRSSFWHENIPHCRRPSVVSDCLFSALDVLAPMTLCKDIAMKITL